MFHIYFLSLILITLTQCQNYEFDTSSAETNNQLDPGRTLPIQPPQPPETLPSFSTVSVKFLHQTMFTKVFNLLLEKGLFYNSPESRALPPYNWECPECLLKKFNFTLGETGEPKEEILLEYLQQILYYSPKPSHPFYLSKSGNGLDPYALVGDWLATTMNSVPLTYFLSPVASLMEIEMVKKLCELVGYPVGEGDGDITPGITISNLMAIQLVLEIKIPKFKELGYIGAGVLKFGIFISTSAISTMERTQSFMGFPKASLIKINVDNRDRLDPVHLEEQIKKSQENGIVPLMVFAMAGTPSFGAIAPLEQIGEICKKYNVWFHVDAGRAGGCLFSEKQKYRLKGIEMSDSVSFSTSKLMGSLHTSTFLLTRHTNALTIQFQNQANYVFRKTGLYTSFGYDRGDSTLQTSRRPEIFKTWFLWKAKGKKGLSAHIDAVYENLEYFVKEMKNPKRKDTFLSLFDDYDTPTVVFQYRPSAGVDLDIEFMNNFTIHLQQALLKSGKLAISLSKVNSSIYLNVLLTNSVIMKEDINYILDTISYYGEKIAIGNFDVEQNDPNSPTPPEQQDDHLNSVTSPIKSLHKEFFTNVFQLFLKQGLFFQNKRKESPCNFRVPEELSKLVDLSLGEEPLLQSEILKQIETVINYTPHSSHPFFLYQLMAGLNPYTLMVDYVGSAINAPSTTFEDSPMATLMEHEVLFALRKIYGYVNGSGDGGITDGGSMCNMMGMAMGRYNMFKDFGRVLGNYVTGGKQLVFFISEDAHYSFNKGSFVQGYGLKNVFPIKTDAKGRMISSELRKAIKSTHDEGKIPFMVAATMGTTIYGAIDPINEIADICKEFKLWFHVDGVFGGSIMMSSKYKSRISGIERSDSMCVNFHKMFGGAHTMSIFLTKYPGIMSQAFGTQKHGINDPRDSYNHTLWDDGEKRFISLKRANVFKIWFLMKALGREGLGAHIDYVYARCDFLVEQLKSMPEKFELVMPEFDLTNILFFYIPKRLRGKEKDKEFYNEIDKVSAELSVLLIQKGILNILAQNRNRGDPSFLKLVVMSSGITDEDIKYILKVIDFYGQDL